MPISRQTFFEIVASFPSGVAIVSTLGADDDPRGLTTTAVSSMSAHPRRSWSASTSDRELWKR
jgi:flavin reductase (DIM6/NTAB) family NADH-FMN oxidoreductase RutF